MDHKTNVEALLVTSAERDSGVGLWSLLEDADGSITIVDGSGMNQGEDLTLSEALADAEMLALTFDVDRLMRGGLPLADAQEIESKMGDMIGGVLHYGPTHSGPVFTRPEAVAYIENRIDPKDAQVIQISVRERDAILAGLRLLQHSLENETISRDGEFIGDLLTQGGEHPGLSNDDIGALCEAINCDDRDPR